MPGEVESARKQVAGTAQAMRDGQLSFLLGARRLASLRHEVGAAADDADFLVFVGIASDTDALPLGDVRARWLADALDRLEPDIRNAEQLAARAGAEACTSLIARFAGR